MAKRMVSPPVGYAPPTKIGYVIPLVSAVRYSVLELDYAAADSGTDSFTVGSSDSGLARAGAVTVDGARGAAAHVLLLEHAVEGKRCLAMLSGVGKMVVGGEVSGGERIVLGDFDDITGLRVRAIVIAPGGTDGELADITVMFDGDQGFVQVPASDGGGGGGGGETPVPPGGGRPPGGFDPEGYLDTIDLEYPGTSPPPELSFGGIAEF